MASRTFTGAWIETPVRGTISDKPSGRTFTGAWIETRKDTKCLRPLRVAPSRVRGLKLAVE